MHPLPRLSEALGRALWIKRDDYTGAELTGNKVRKLEFLLRDAIAQGADTVITCGGLQSNHARATALAAARLGLSSHLVLRGQAPEVATGNLLLGALAGAEIHFITPEQYRDRARILEGHASALRQRGRTPYIIPEGGSNALGAFGYVRAAQEIAIQSEEAGVRFDTVVVAVGSGGTLAGLVVGHKLWPGRIPAPIGINVCDDAPYFQRVVAGIAADMADRFGTPACGEDEVALIDGFVGLGYALSTCAELESIARVARSEGVLLDPVYTGKAFHALERSIARNDPRIGEKILFIHTGGIFGLFPKAGTLAEPLANDG
jgi:D-cysteine desulfhydrase